MATPINAPFNGDLWHLSIEDLLAPLPEAPRLGGAGPFVINLTASTAPVSQPKDFVFSDRTHVYQVQRMEEHRMRYRLRLGPFATEDEANAVLEKVRETYPGAMTASAETEDLRAILAWQAKAEALRLAAERAKPELIVEPPAAAKAPPPLKPAATVRPAQPVPATPDGAKLKESPRLEDSSAIPVLTTAVVQGRRASTPLDRTVPAAVRPAASQVPAATAPRAAIAPTLQSAAAAPSAPRAPSAPSAASAPRAPAPGAVPTMRRPVAKLETHLTSLESTQTIRPLTPRELEDSSTLRWYVIQLAVSETAFDPDSLPNLDIFGEYRLYAVSGLDQGRVVHALRMGFFSEEAAAAAVASYLGVFYEAPTIRRVSAAERERFANFRFEARKDIGATGRHAVIEITNERVVRERRERARAEAPSIAPPPPRTPARPSK